MIRVIKLKCLITSVDWKYTAWPPSLAERDKRERLI
jgi:hypothetical protein